MHAASLYASHASPQFEPTLTHDIRPTASGFIPEIRGGCAGDGHRVNRSVWSPGY